MPFFFFGFPFDIEGVGAEEADGAMYFLIYVRWMDLAFTLKGLLHKIFYVFSCLNFVYINK